MSESQQAGEPLSQRQEQLDRHIAARVDDLLRGLHERFGEQVRTANQELLQWLETQMPEIPVSFLGGFDLSQLSEPPIAPAKEDAVGEVLSAVAAIDGEVGQAEILTALLEQGQRFASKTAFFLIREGQVRGWAGRGFDGDPTPSYIGQANSGPWASMLEAGASVALDAEAAAETAGALGTAPDAAVVIPFSIRGVISGALWAENGVGGSLDAASLQLVTHAAAMALETAAVSPGLSPTLQLQGELPVASGFVSEPSDAVEPVAEASVSEDDVEPAASEEAPAPGPSEVAAEGAAEAEALAEPEPSFEMTPSAVVEPAPEPVVESQVPEVDSGDEEPAVEEEGVPEETAPVATVDQADYETPVDEAQTEYVPVDEDDEPESVSTSATDEPDSPPAAEDSYLPTDDDIALEAEPEPELEDTNIWELEEDEDEDDEEPTQVGMAAAAVGASSEASTEAPSVAVEAPQEAQPAPAIAGPVGQETVRIDLATIQQDQAALQTPEPVAEQPADVGDETSPTMHAMPQTASPEASPPEPDPAAGSFVEPPSSFTDPAPPVAGYGSAPSSFAEPEPPPPQAPAAPEFSSAPAPEPEPEEKPEAVGGSTEVVPPPDLDGPGLAFATPEPAAAEQKVDEGDAALHEEARRLARLLVSEIKLYNEEIIEEGRRSGNIYERLKDDIDRSRQMYEERIDPRLADQEDYFYQELVQRLAGGEERLLGM